MACDKVVCEREYVTKLCEAAGPGRAGYRIKNKNPTQRRGEKSASPDGDLPLSCKSKARSGLCICRFQECTVLTCPVSFCTKSDGASHETHTCTKNKTISLSVIGGGVGPLL